jgi:hypothetical protein
LEDGVWDQLLESAIISTNPKKLAEVSECCKGRFGINVLKVLIFSLDQEASLTSASVVRGVWHQYFENAIIPKLSVANHW